MNSLVARAKWNYVIVDTINGEVLGTDFYATAQGYAMSDDYYVIEVNSGAVIIADVDATKEIDIRSLDDGPA